MKKPLYQVLILTIVLSQVFSACSTDEVSSDDEENNTDSIVLAEDFTTTITENPDKGVVLGTIAATVTEGVLHFAFESQSVSGALAIDQNTGVVTVANEGAFDYETNPTVTGVVTISSGDITETVTVTIEVKDAIKCLISKISDGTTKKVIETRTYDDQNRISQVNEYGTDGEILLSHAYVYENDKITVTNKDHTRAYEWDSKYTLNNGLAVSMEELKIPNLILEYDRDQTWTYDDNNFMLSNHMSDSRYAGNVTGVLYDFVIKDDTIASTTLRAFSNTDVSKSIITFTYNTSLENKQDKGEPFFGKPSKNLIALTEIKTLDPEDDSVMSTEKFNFSYVLDENGYVIEEFIEGISTLYEYICVDAE